jgi:hypothetical protein
LLLSLFLLSLIGHHLVFELAKWDAKNIIRHQIQSGSVNAIVEKIPANPNMQWEEVDREFELNGQMYDVVKTETIHHQTIYYCINDGKESELLQVYKNWIQSDKSNDTQKQHAKGLLKYVSIECDMPFQSSHQPQLYLIPQKIVPNKLIISTRNLLVEAPPPKLLA